MTEKIDEPAFEWEFVGSSEICGEMSKIQTVESFRVLTMTMSGKKTVPRK